MQRKVRKELSAGILCVAIALTLKQFTITPEFILGGLLGIGICLEFIGVLQDKAYDSLKDWKKKLFNKFQK